MLKGDSLLIQRWIKYWDYTYVEDIAEANLKALYYGDNDIFNIGTGRATDLNII